jgi:hypothetical protein
VAQRPGLARPVIAVATVVLFAAGCGGRPPARETGLGADVSTLPTYQVGQDWTAKPGWRIRITAQRCGPAATLDEEGAEAPDVCLVAVGFTNVGDRSRPFAGTPDDAGPTWRVVGYDAQTHEFHGHSRPTPDTPPGGTGSAELVFEVPAGLRLSRVLLGDAIVALS